MKSDTTVIFERIDDLPFSGGFWHTPIKFQNKIFAIQNVMIDSIPEFSYFDKKSILSFDGNSWENSPNF